jgi:tetratricopeptide (TPR) repeat protein
MKKSILAVILLLSFLISTAQNKGEAAQLVSEGIELHDKGDYEGAIKKYEAALKIDNDYFNAHYEKSYSLTAMGKLKECAGLCKDILKKFPEHPGLNAVYIQYGSVLDDLGKPKEALEVYNEGISKYPNEFLLYFNKGLTLQKLAKYDEALLEYQHSLQLKPLHSSSNYYTGLLLQKENKIPALLAYCTFLAIEPASKRSRDAFTGVKEIMGANVKKEGNNITIFMDPAALNDDKKQKKENNFRTAELLFTMSAALDNSKDADSIAKTPQEKFSLKFQLLIGSLAEGSKDNKGFYWDHYVPFYMDMKEKGFVELLARLVYLSEGKEEENREWLKDNEDKVSEFYDWIKGYKWK